jgi:type I restriction enzyme S subunit
MGDWTETTLGKLCASGDGGIQTGPFGSQLHAYDYVLSGIPSVMPQNIGDNKVLEDNIARISEEDADRLARYRLQGGDIVYSRRGDVERRAFIYEHQDGWLCGTGCLRVRIGDAANSRFMSYYLGSPEARSWIVRHAVGATMPNLNTSILSALPIKIPSIVDQHAIANLLGTLDDKIAINDRVGSAYERILALHFNQLGIDVDPAERMGVTASKLVEFNPPVPPPDREDAVYLDMASLPTSTARVQEWSRRMPKSGTRFTNGDVVMARITPCLENGKTAFIDFMDEGEIGVGSTEFIVMRPRDTVPDHVPYFLARSERFREIAIRNMVGSSGRQRVAAVQLADVALSQPDETALADFGEQASAGFAHMKSLGAESAVLAQLRDTLLPKLMSGELRVKDAEKVVEEST